MLCLVQTPGVISGLLFSWREISMSLCIHGPNLFIIILLWCISQWVQYFLSTLTWHGIQPKRELILFNSWPVVSSFVTGAKRLSNLGVVFSFLDVIELISETLQVLSLDNFSDSFTTIVLLSAESVVVRDWDSQI